MLSRKDSCDESELSDNSFEISFRTRDQLPNSRARHEIARARYNARRDRRAAALAEMGEAGVIRTRLRDEQFTAFINSGPLGPYRGILDIPRLRLYFEEELDEIETGVEADTMAARRLYYRDVSDISEIDDYEYHKNCTWPRYSEYFRMLAVNRRNRRIARLNAANSSSSSSNSSSSVSMTDVLPDMRSAHYEQRMEERRTQRRATRTNLGPLSGRGPRNIPTIVSMAALNSSFPSCFNVRITRDNVSTPIDSRTVALGREEERCPASYSFISLGESRSVSRYQALIHFLEDPRFRGFYLINKSKPMTVNGRQLLVNESPRLLSNGDRIEVGRIHFYFHFERRPLSFDQASETHPVPESVNDAGSMEEALRQLRL